MAEGDELMADAGRKGTEGILIACPGPRHTLPVATLAGGT